jgi:hypothetical protein
MCSEANARLVDKNRLHYLFRLNDNQPTLRHEAERLLGGAEQPLAKTVDVVGKYTVTRWLYRTTEMAGFLDWTHLHTVLRIHSEKRRIDTDELVEQEDRYYLSSHDGEGLTDEQWLLLVRRHWAVENNCHHTWDTAFKEDDKPWIEADPKAMLVLLLLRRIAYNIAALFRSVTQRSDENRRTPWKKLLRSFYNTLIAATADDLAGLRRRKGAAALLG